jgi:hypothetical protein
VVANIPGAPQEPGKGKKESRRAAEGGREQEVGEEGGRGRRAGGKSHKNPKRTKYHLIHYN